MTTISYISIALLTVPLTLALTVLVGIVGFFAGPKIAALRARAATAYQSARQTAVSYARLVFVAREQELPAPRLSRA